MYITNHGVAVNDVAAIFKTAATSTRCRSTPRWKSPSPRTITRRATCTECRKEPARTCREPAGGLPDTPPARRRRSWPARRPAAARQDPLAERDARSQAADDGVLRKSRCVGLRTAEAVRAGARSRSRNAQAVLQERHELTAAPTYRRRNPTRKANFWGTRHTDTNAFTSWRRMQMAGLRSAPRQRMGGGAPIDGTSSSTWVKC